jgi:hypothetical protein
MAAKVLEYVARGDGTFNLQRQILNNLLVAGNLANYGIVQNNQDSFNTTHLFQVVYNPLIKGVHSRFEQTVLKTYGSKFFCSPLSRELQNHCALSTGDCGSM